MSLDPLRFTAALAAAAILIGCEKPISPAPPAVPIAAPSAATNTTAEPAPPLREGLRLEHLADVGLHVLGDTLLVTARNDTPENAPIHVYVAKGDHLAREPDHDLDSTTMVETLRLAGHYPDRVFALATTFDGRAETTKLLRRAPAGWASETTPAFIRNIADFAGGIYGYVVAPGSPVRHTLVRVDAKGPDPSIPAGTGPACDGFYKNNLSTFEKLAVQPRGISTAAGMLFLLGMGCDQNVAVAAYRDATTPPGILAIDTRTFFDGFAGTIVGNRPDDLWFFRRPMRPMTLATLFHFDGKHFTETKWPSEDPQAEAVAVDTTGTLWALVDGKLLFLKPGTNTFKEKPLPERCEPRALAATPGSLWIACNDAVARISTEKTPEP